MTNINTLAKNSLIIGLIGLAMGCVAVGPREGYYDGDHHRYYHENAWHACVDADEHCR